MLTPGNKRRYRKLYDAALNLGMSASDAQHYATEALTKEMETGDWQIVPQCAEAQHSGP